MSSTSDRTHRAVRGALQNVIEAHGPITEEWIESATKRVVAQIRSQAEQGAKPSVTARPLDGRGEIMTEQKGNPE